MTIDFSPPSSIEVTLVGGPTALLATEESGFSPIRRSIPRPRMSPAPG